MGFWPRGPKRAPEKSPEFTCCLARCSTSAPGTGLHHPVMISSKRVRAAVVAVATVATFPALPASGAQAHQPPAGAACAPDASLIGFSDALDKTTFAGTPVSGLSALALSGASRGLALVDNIGTTPARVYDVDLDAGKRG